MIGDLFVLVGIVILCVGVWMVYPPAAIMLLGICCIVFGAALSKRP